MSYEDEQEHERHKEKAKLIEEVVRKLEEAFGRIIERQHALYEKRAEFRRLSREHVASLGRRGVNSGLDEAIHMISKELALEVLREDRETRAALKAYIGREFRKWSKSAPGEGV